MDTAAKDCSEPKPDVRFIITGPPQVLDQKYDPLLDDTRLSVVPFY